MQHDMNIANQGFPAFRADLNNALGALVSNNSGATAPATTFAHQYWVDTSANPSILKIRNADNDAFITIGTINQTADTFTLTAAVSATTLNTSGQVVFNDAGANVDFRVEGDTDANLLFVDASADKVGIGTNTPLSRFVVSNGSNENIEFIPGSTTLNGGVIQYINRDTGTTRPDMNYFLSQGGGAHKFFTLEIQRMLITSDGFLRMASSSGGIQFNGDTAAANALDDYEEGTFPPTIVGSTSAGTANYFVQLGGYTKIGNQVFFFVHLNYDTGTGTGNLRIGGLPFTSINTLNNIVNLSTYTENIAATANNVIVSQVNNGVNHVNMLQTPTGGGAASFLPYDNAGIVMLSGTYFV